MNITLKVLLDSTYLLPTFGIEVEGLLDEHLARLREIAVKGRVRLYCLTVTWIEVIGKVCRESQRLKIDLGETINTAIKSLLTSGFYEWIQPPPNAVKLAFKLRMLGHKDIIDNLLYATSVVNDMVFLTMDEDLKNFLMKRGFKTDNLMDHIQLLSRVKF